MFNDCLSKLLKDSVHVCALSRPQALKETNMAAVTGDEHGQVRILLHRLHWDGCKGNKYSGPVFFPIHAHNHFYIYRASEVTLLRLPGPTMGGGKDVIGSVQTQHRHLHRFQPVDRTGVVVIVIVGRIAKHYGGEPLIEFPNGLCL